MSESAILKRIMLACGNGAVRLWRNNVGTLRDERGQYVKYGLCNGSSDLIGYKTVTITHDMVGSRIACFVALEVKTAKGPVRAEQLTFISAIESAGGIAAIVRSEEEAQRILTRGH